MSTNNILLTICIPTYNRPNHINTQVKDVLKQLNPETRLIVLDNHSEIAVESLFSKEELSLFTIIRHHTNIGGDANNARCLEIVQYGWVWLLGDDDRISSNAVSIILQLIKSHNDYCFINTGNKETKEIKSFEEFANHLKIRGVWGNSFFQSACLYNMNHLYKSLFWLYDFLSTQVGQFCIILKHIELNDAKCLFTKINIIKDKEGAKWNKLQFIDNTSLLFDRMYYKRKILRSSLFKVMVDSYLEFLACSDTSFKERLHYLKLILNKMGIINLILYNRLYICMYIIRRFFPLKLYNYLVQIYKRKNV